VGGEKVLKIKTALKRPKRSPGSGFPAEICKGHLEAASGLEPLSKGFAVLRIWVTKSYQTLTVGTA